ncbi:hypothetical protein F5Y13DRAFT_66901 [Hypoxylon sp. FL1857]|nr:hypothetical protein F5Y13DRAFT_66901 [Hypoxylon sp. FL1857]
MVMLIEIEPALSISELDTGYVAMCSVAIATLPETAAVVDAAVIALALENILERPSSLGSKNHSGCYHIFANWLNVTIAGTGESFRYQKWAAARDLGGNFSSDSFSPRLESGGLPVLDLSAATHSQSFLESSTYETPKSLSGRTRTLESQAPTPSLDQPLNFGCPFHKAYPYRFPSCKERSLKDTSRVKEHIYRSHLVFQCQRCGDTFPEEMALGEHLRSNPACESVDHGPVEYAINQEQREILRSRKGLKGTSEPDRWLQIYKMVCPEALPPYPSPYTNAKYSNETLQEFASFAHQEMPSLINAELNMLSSRDTITLDDTSRQSIQIMMGKVLDNLVDRFESGRPSPTRTLPAQSQQENVGALKNTVGDFNFDFDFDFDFNLDMDVGDLGTPGHGNLHFMTEEMVDAGTGPSSSHKRALDSDVYDDLNTGPECNKRRS